MRRLFAFVIDLGAVATATCFALLLRDNFETSWPQFLAFLPYVAMSVAACGMTLLAFGLHRSVWRLSTLHDYVRIVIVSALAVGVAMGVGFMSNRLENVARALPVIQFMLLLGSLIGVRVAARLLYSQRSRASADLKGGDVVADSLEDCVLVVGLNRLANLFVHAVREQGGTHVRIAGLLDRDLAQHGRAVAGLRVLGAPTDAVDVVKGLSVHGVFVTRILVAVRRDQLTQEERAALWRAADTFGLRLDYLGDALGLQGRAKPAPAVNDTPEQHSSPLAATLDFASVNEQFVAFARRPYWQVKRVLDVLVAASLILLLGPLFLLVALVVAIDCGTPVIFWQLRPGTGGRPFNVYKFRTMGASHAADGRARSDRERTSRVGAMLRAVRLDELPQLFNVLVGEMSFVGPRPLLPVDQHPGLRARLAIPPGITGWAQIHGGRDVSAADKAAMDLWYLKNASLLVDLRICLQTVRVIVDGEQANHAAIAAAWSEINAVVTAAKAAAVRVPKPSESRVPEVAAQAIA